MPAEPNPYASPQTSDVEAGANSRPAGWSWLFTAVFLSACGAVMAIVQGLPWPFAVGTFLVLLVIFYTALRRHAKRLLAPADHHRELRSGRKFFVFATAALALLALIQVVTQGTIDWGLTVALLFFPLILWTLHRAQRRWQVMTALQEQDFSGAEQMLAAMRSRRFERQWALQASVVLKLNQAAGSAEAEEHEALQAAMQIAEQLVAGWPRKAPSYVALAGVLNRKQEYQAAMQAIARAAALKPNAYYVFLLRGSIRQCSGIASKNAEDLQQAKADLERACQRAPARDIEARHALARFLAAAPEAAVRDPQRAIELERELVEKLGPRQNEGWAVMAAAHANLGEFRQAVELALAAIEHSRPVERGRFDRLLRSCQSGQPFYLAASGRWWPW